MRRGGLWLSALRYSSTTLSKRIREWGCVVDLDVGRLRCQPPDLLHELARCGHGEVRGQGGFVGPLFEKHQPQRILRVPVHAVRNAAGFWSRPAHVGLAVFEERVKGIGPRHNAACYKDHASYDIRQTKGNAPLAGTVTKQMSKRHPPTP